MSDQSITAFKICSKCKQSFPANSQFFLIRHNESKDGLTGKCRNCFQNYKQMWRRKHGTKPQNPNLLPDGRKRCPDCGKVFPATRDYFHSARGRLRKLCKACQSRAYKVYYAQNQQKERERDRLRKRDRRQSASKRRALKSGSTGTYTASDVTAQYKCQKGQCYYAECKHASLKNGYHVDHVIPLSRGGSNGPDNIVLACPHCNLTKFNRLPHEWPEGGRLL